MNPISTAINGEETTAPGTPLSALSAFYRAFNHRELDQMRRNWHPEECVLKNPLGGIRRGWAEIEPLYSRLFGGPAKVYVEYFDYTLHQGRDLFCASGRERGTFEKGEARIDLSIRTTRIYRWVDGNWLQIHHHGSIDNPELLRMYQQAVL